MLQQHPSPFADEATRRRALTIVLRIAEGIQLEPKAYERMLLEQFVHGQLPLDQVLERLETQP